MTRHTPDPGDNGVPKTCARGDVIVVKNRNAFEYEVAWLAPSKPRRSSPVDLDTFDNDSDSSDTVSVSEISVKGKKKSQTIYYVTISITIILLVVFVGLLVGLLIPFKSPDSAQSFVESSNYSNDEPSIIPTLSPLSPIQSPIQSPIHSPIKSSTQFPVQSSIQSPDIYPYNTILNAGETLLKGNTTFSPNGAYSLEFNEKGSLILKEINSKEVLWISKDKGSGKKCSLQADGNLVIRKENGRVTWSSATSGNPGTDLRLDNGGQVSLVSSKGTSLWLTGIPRGVYTGNSSIDLEFPIRGVFYYTWFPETWKVNGKEVFYNPTLGRYSNSDGDLQKAHIDALNYMHADIAIASWFGSDTHLDRARLTNLMIKSKNKKTKWTVYYEQEMRQDQSIDYIRQDLAYLKKWFAWRDTWAHIDGKPVIFVYNEAGCDVTERWSKASGGEWYVVLKVFPNDENCDFQPDHWHQYGPKSKVAHNSGSSFVISPGFWRADLPEAGFTRVGKEEWRQTVGNMVASKEPWQLITTFNEWGEGTAIESAKGWESSTGYGWYLDILHDIKGG